MLRGFVRRFSALPIVHSQPGPGMFYRRPLPATCVDFSSPGGKSLFAEALAAGNMESYFMLASQFRTQDEPAFCGLSSLVMVLNALSIDPGRAVRVWGAARAGGGAGAGSTLDAAHVARVCSGRDPGAGSTRTWYVCCTPSWPLATPDTARPLFPLPVPSAGLLCTVGNREEIGIVPGRLCGVCVCCVVWCLGGSAHGVMPPCPSALAFSSSLAQGITLPQFACLARCNAARVDLTFGDRVTLSGT